MSRDEHPAERRADMRLVFNDVRQLKRDVTELKAHSVTKEDFGELQRSIEGLVTAWETAGGLVRFVKWLSAFVAAVAALWLAIRAILDTPILK